MPQSLVDSRTYALRRMSFFCLRERAHTHLSSVCRDTCAYACRRNRTHTNDYIEIYMHACMHIYMHACMQATGCVPTTWFYAHATECTHAPTHVRPYTYIPRIRNRHTQRNCIHAGGRARATRSTSRTDVLQAAAYQGVHTKGTRAPSPEAPFGLSNTDAHADCTWPHQLCVTTD